MFELQSKLWMETQDTWQEWVFVGGYLALLLFVIWGVLFRQSRDDRD